MSKNWPDYVRRYFPKLEDRECMDLLLARTAFPFVRPARVKRQLQGLPRALHRAQKAQRPLCDHCNRLAGDKYRYECNGCGATMRSVKYEVTVAS